MVSTVLMSVILCYIELRQCIDSSATRRTIDTKSFGILKCFC